MAAQVSAPLREVDSAVAAFRQPGAPQQGRASSIDKRVHELQRPSSRSREITDIDRRLCRENAACTRLREIAVQ